MRIGEVLWYLKLSNVSSNQNFITQIGEVFWYLKLSNVSSNHILGHGHGSHDSSWKSDVEPNYVFFNCSLLLDIRFTLVHSWNWSKATQMITLQLLMVFFFIKNYSLLVLRLKWPKARYKIIQHYNDYCVAMLTRCSQSF